MHAARPPTWASTEQRPFAFRGFVRSNPHGPAIRLGVSASASTALHTEAILWVASCCILAPICHETGCQKKRCVHVHAIKPTCQCRTRSARFGDMSLHACQCIRRTDDMSSPPVTVPKRPCSGRTARVQTRVWQSAPRTQDTMATWRLPFSLAWGIKGALCSNKPVALPHRIRIPVRMDMPFGSMDATPDASPHKPLFAFTGHALVFVSPKFQNT